jgi:DNA-binding protein, stimulates sugar fermentation
MNFNETLISGEFIKRYKRFFVDIKMGNNTITAHCPNTGSMMGLLKKGNKVWFSRSDNPKRKLKYTLQIFENQNSKIGINTHLTNKIVFDALKKRSIKNFIKLDDIKQKVKFGENTRFDFLLTEKQKKLLLR